MQKLDKITQSDRHCKQSDIRYPTLRQPAISSDRQVRLLGKTLSDLRIALMHQWYR